MLRLLEEHSWKVLFTDRDGNGYVRRPGKNSGQCSAALNRDNGKVHVFSTNTDLPAGESFAPSAVYAYLKHGGNFSEAAGALRREGNGGLG